MRKRTTKSRAKLKVAGSPGSPNRTFTSAAKLGLYQGNKSGSVLQFKPRRQDRSAQYARAFILLASLLAIAAALLVVGQ